MPEKNNKGILDFDYSGVSSVDLSTPLGEDEKFPQMAIYLSPEEVRRREEERSRKLLEERRAIMAEEAARLNKKKGEKSKAKSGSSKSTKSASKIKDQYAEKDEEPIKKKKVSRKKNTQETEPKKKSRKTGQKKSKKKSVSKQEISENTQNESLNEIKKTPVKTLLDLDDLYVSYILHLESATEITSEPPTLIADFTLRNRILNNSLLKVSFNFESTSDIQFDNALLEVGELQSDEQKEITIEFRVLGIVGVGLSVTGNIAYSTQLSSEEETTNHNIPIKFELPLSIFMLNIPNITPEQFKAIVSQTSNFPFSGTTLIQLNHTGRTFEQIFQDESIRLTSIATGAHIVEVVSSAITIYGRSVQGYQVAGLAKFSIESNMSNTVENEPGDDKVNIKIELKCSDQAFLDGLIREIDNMFNEKI